MYLRYIKRIFDLTFSIVILFLSFPLVFLGMLIVVRGDSFPIFYTQDRVGLGGKVFKVFKLRTMKQGHSNLGNTSYKHDPRYFIGSEFLRKTKIDELPQIYNVLVGEMSIIGPRPTVMEDYEKMSESQRKRFTITPGLTGLAQVSGNTALKWPKRIELDLKYITNCSFSLDAKILFKTIFLLLSNKIDTNPPDSGEW